VKGRWNPHLLLMEDWDVDPKRAAEKPKHRLHFHPITR